MKKKKYLLLSFGCYLLSFHGFYFGFELLVLSSCTDLGWNDAHILPLLSVQFQIIFYRKNIFKKQSTFDLGPNCRTNGNPIVGLELTTSWIKRALLQRVRVWGRSHVLYDCSCQTQVKETKTASKEPSFLNPPTKTLNLFLCKLFHSFQPEGFVLSEHYT